MSLSEDTEGPLQCMLAVERFSLPNDFAAFHMEGHNHILTHVTLYGTLVHCSLAKLIFSHMNILPYHGFPFSNKAANTKILCEIRMHSFLYPPSHGLIFICHMLSNVYTLFPALTHSWPKKVKVKQFLWSPGQTLRVPGS